MTAVLITGFDGFIGAYLLPFLKLSKKQIIGIHNNDTKHSDIKVIKKDIRRLSSNDIKDDISLIIHLAALTDVDYCQNNANECFDVNVIGTKKILDIALKKNSKVVFVSSSHVFGIPKSNPVKESDPKNPVSIYGKSKLACELLCESYSLSYELDISVVRLFSVYGYKSQGKDVVSKIVSKVFTNDDVNLGNLFPKRDFIYVNDVISAIQLIIKNTRGFSSYNIGMSTSYSISQICDIINRLSGKNLSIKSKRLSTRKIDVKDIRANNNKIKKLGWKPLHTIFSGLSATLEYYKDIDSNNK